jgi:hypothetical protein
MDQSETREGRMRLAISSCGAEHDPRAVVLGPSQDSSEGAFELFGKGDVPYGLLEPGHGGGFIVKVRGRSVMSIECGSDLFEMTASSMDGLLLASASKNIKSGSYTEEMWNLKITKNNDAVLIAACMLAPLFYHHD